jgi:hypothetical protein
MNITARDITLSIAGTYGSFTINRIRLVCRRTNRPDYSLYVYSGSWVLIADIYTPTYGSQDRTNTNAVLTFTYNGGGKTFKLIDLPTNNPGVPGAVYRNGNQLMIS